MKYTTAKLVLSCMIIFISCTRNSDPPLSGNNVGITGTQQFSDYWYAGKAEISSYKLKQSRYGEIHDGKAVLIFVTEPFSASAQVKLDDPEAAGKDKITVMKMNFTKKFNTGIYPYSMMLSTFTPVDEEQHPYTLKVTMSAQEWCGQVYSQVNMDKKKYDIRSFSYFEQDGDQHFELKTAFLEDEVWTRIRLNYKSLPIGNIEVFPGLFFTRLNHKDFNSAPAKATLKEIAGEAVYQLSYPERVLSITFNTDFPYKITAWKETYTGLGGKTLTTSATLDETVYTDYWTKNSKADSHWRDSLNLQ